MKPVVLEWHNEIAEVRLNRPKQSNSLILESFKEILAIGEQLINNKNVKAVVLTGEGKHFCAGLDASLFPKGTDSSAWFVELAKTAVHKSGANLFQRCATLWGDLPVPVIAAVQGAAFGGGCQLALGADIRLADPSSQFSLMETHWGLIPDMGITQTLPSLLRADIAAELILTSKIIAAEEAAQIGLITRVSDDSRKEAFAMAQKIAGMSPNAIRASKQLCQQSWRPPAEHLLKLEADLQIKLFGSKQQVECVTANLQKRKPQF